MVEEGKSDRRAASEGAGKKVTADNGKRSKSATTTTTSTRECKRQKVATEEDKKVTEKVQKKKNMKDTNKASFEELKKRQQRANLVEKRKSAPSVYNQKEIKIEPKTEKEDSDSQPSRTLRYRKKTTRSAGQVRERETVIDRDQI